MGEDKIKVAIITHFSNEHIRNHLKLSEYKFDNWIRSLVGQKSNRFQKDFAPWVTLLIKEFEVRQDVELHIIAPYMGLAKCIEEFEDKGIFYHFFNCDLISYYLESLMLLLERDFMSLNYKKNRTIVRQLVDKIKPDVINLFGAENPYYACTVLDIQNIPIISSCQTVYTNPAREKSERVSRRRWEMEERVFKHVKYFGVFCGLYDQLVRRTNPNAICFEHKIPSVSFPDIDDVNYEFDFVNFAASHCFKKGSHDCIRALAIVKKKYPNVTLNIAGGCPLVVKKELQQLINQFDLNDNVVFSSYFPKHIDLFYHLKKSRFAVLPVKLDVLSGTITQSMKLGLPLVTNITSGTILLNKDKECVLLTEMNDIEGLANNMIKLMDSQNLAALLRKNAREYYDKNFDNAKIVEQLVLIYKAIIKHNEVGGKISDELLFHL